MKIVIIGAGEVGYHVARRLALEHKDVVVVDRDGAALRRVSDSLDVQVVRGEGGSPLVLQEAGIREAEILLAVTDSDEVNLVACLVTDMLSPNTRKLVRIRNADFDACHSLLREGAPHIESVINPEIEAVRTIERLIRLPGAVEAGELVGGLVQFVGIRLDEGSSMDGMPLPELPKYLGSAKVLVAAVLRDEKLIIPSGKDFLKAGDLVYLVSGKKHLLQVMEAFGKASKPVRRVLIVGGGRLGLRLAASLEKDHYQVKIIERRSDRCRELAARLEKAVILHGDGSDQSLLAEENVRGVDVMVTLTGDEQTNILVSLLARKMGVGAAITRLTRFAYFPLMSSIGVHQIVSPRLSAIDSILQHIRRGKVLSTLSIQGEQAEVMEAVALPTSDIVGRPLSQLSFPKGALVITIIRGDEIIIPSGDSVIAPDDRVVIFARRKSVPKVEKALTVKLEYF
ncbi:Trk system potassium transporter TrkA [Desulfobotulus sp. H1]|uniref:Trk system potassium uptake protein TrkA n=1 Tax=Desulfobotulus pelophilus TaxID=2823377 RepID=A0ABT3N5F5_9BACT|nr:Trk system potassium transporter TrkA [Desulfobotulus pelophilus]MCW7752401.1 Trk system potassium transporter TrkA [Desulfobotulus pelophilus]